ncbi:unnamed protein product [Meganyctiphanes norvegica]|uniref:Uncharacterized protein n=1 Tax=Meganyctiphanes norvegica TaxID=48144 RepID=A0AAV2REH3_MEGNR
MAASATTTQQPRQEQKLPHEAKQGNDDSDQTPLILPADCGQDDTSSSTQQQQDKEPSPPPEKEEEKLTGLCHCLDLKDVMYLVGMDSEALFLHDLLRP